MMMEQNPNITYTGSMLADGHEFVGIQRGDTIAEQVLLAPKPDWGLPHKHITQQPAELPPHTKREDNGPVSRLQEWVQAQSKQGNYQRILHWNFEQQMEDRITLQFKATVSFMLDNVPHHIEGDWQTSKKKSQRDAAARALYHFTNLDEVTIPEGATPIERLELFDSSITFGIDKQDDLFRATAKFSVGGSVNYFRGSWQETEQAAKEDCAIRTCAYLRVSEYRVGFDTPIVDGVHQTTFDMKAHSDGNYALRIAQQKTALMQVQNLLQKVYSKNLVPGQDMWDWQWNTDPNTGKNLVKVDVPVTGQTFYGQWCTGKKEAQRTTCEELKTFLEAKLKEQEGDQNYKKDQYRKYRSNNRNREHKSNNYHNGGHQGYDTHKK